MRNGGELENYNVGKIKSSQRIVSKEVVFLFVSLVISLAIFFVFLLPEYKKMKIMGFEIGLIKDNLKTRENTANKIEDFNEKYEDVKTKDLDKIGSLLSDRNNFEEHLANIDNSAKVNGILIDNFSITESAKSSSENGKYSKNSVSNENGGDSEFETVEINFSAKGAFSNFVLFLNSLEKNIPLVDLNKLRIKKNETEDEKTVVETETETEENVEIETNPDILEYDVTLSFYYL